MKSRCDWAGDNRLMIDYHDNEWGVPVFDDRTLFEFLILEGMQAGLSWQTILNKRENFRKAFDNFDIQKVSRYQAAKIEKLVIDKGIIRHRGKIEAAIGNARAALEVSKQFGSFSAYIWSFVERKPIVNRFRSMKEIPAHTDLAADLSKDLKKRTFKFVGPTICYAYMQAVGMVNDHTIDCDRYQQIIDGY